MTVSVRGLNSVCVIIVIIIVNLIIINNITIINITIIIVNTLINGQANGHIVLRSVPLIVPLTQLD